MPHQTQSTFKSIRAILNGYVGSNDNTSLIIPPQENVLAKLQQVDANDSSRWMPLAGLKWYAVVSTALQCFRPPRVRGLPCPRREYLRTLSKSLEGQS
jgi:hypothetical protein